jgi:hypothetical protein
MCDVTKLMSHIGEGAESQGARNRTNGYVPQKTPWQGAWDWEENRHIRIRHILIRPWVIVLYR